MVNIVSITNTFQNEPFINEQFLKKKIVGNPVGFLAASVALKRMRSTRLHVEEDSILAVKEHVITLEDTIIAGKIKDYYSKKIMMLNLLGKPISKFREDLSKFIHSDSIFMDHTLIPLVTKLPYFYDYDSEFELMVHGLNKSTHGVHVFSEDSPTLTLTKLRKFDTKGRIGKKTEYWFKDKNNCLFVLYITHDNILKSMFDKVYDSNAYMNFKNCNCSMKYRDDIKFQFINKFDLA